MDDQEWLDQNVSNDPAMIEFLAEALANFMAVNRRNNQVWTKKRVSVWITADANIEGRLNDTTLGRFLDPAYEQEPSPETARKVAHFLLLEGGITRRDIELHAAAQDIRLASAIGGLGGGTDSKTHGDLLASLNGIYLSHTLVNGYLLFTRLALIHRKDANALLADEIQRLYWVADSTKLRDWQLGFERGDIASPDRAIAAMGGRALDSFVSSGFVIGSKELGIVLLRASALGYSGALNVSAIEFDEDDRITGFLSGRNSGWSVKAVDDIVLPIAVTPDTSPRDIVKHLARDSNYRKQSHEQIRNLREFDKKDKNNIEEKDVLGFVDLSNDYEKEIMIEELSEENLLNKTPNEILELALKWSDLAVFCDALEAGADANFIPEGVEDPVIFLLAKDGKHEWVEALLETGRCDLTRIDKKGLAASYYPAVTARTFAATKAAPDEVRRFGRLANQLRDARRRQLSAAIDAEPAPS